MLGSWKWGCKIKKNAQKRRTFDFSGVSFCGSAFIRGKLFRDVTLSTGVCSSHYSHYWLTRIDSLQTDVDLLPKGTLRPSFDYRAFNSHPILLWLDFDDASTSSFHYQLFRAGKIETKKTKLCNLMSKYPHGVGQSTVEAAIILVFQHLPQRQRRSLQEINNFISYINSRNTLLLYRHSVTKYS